MSQATMDEVREEQGECQFCGMSNEDHQDKHGKSLSVHHIIPRRANGTDEKDNLITVCQSCHQTLENSQAEALSRLADRQADQEKVEELEDELDRCQERLEDTNEQYDNAHSAFQSTVNALTQRTDITIHIVHKGGMLNSELIYAGTDQDIAVEKYKDESGYCKLETSKLVGFEPHELIDIDEVENGMAKDGIREIKEESGDSDDL